MLLFVKFLCRVRGGYVGFSGILPECLGLLLVVSKDLHFHILIGRFSALENYFMKSVRTFVLAKLDFLHGDRLFLSPNLFEFLCNACLLSRPLFLFRFELVLVI